MSDQSPIPAAANQSAPAPLPRVEVKRDLCIGAASCVAVAPNVFALDEENIAIVTNPQGDTFENITMAAQACPTKAIYVWNEAGKQIWPE